VSTQSTRVSTQSTHVSTQSTQESREAHAARVTPHAVPARMWAGVSPCSPGAVTAAVAARNPRGNHSLRQSRPQDDWRSGNFRRRHGGKGAGVSPCSPGADVGGGEPTQSEMRTERKLPTQARRGYGAEEEAMAHLLPRRRRRRRRRSCRARAGRPSLQVRSFTAPHEYSQHPMSTHSTPCECPCRSAVPAGTVFHSTP
jgi:hypothetical protein